MVEFYMMALRILNHAGSYLRKFGSVSVVGKLNSPQFYKMEHTSASASAANYNFETLQVTQPKDFVFHVEMNRPKKMNAMTKTFWREIGQCFKQLGEDPDCRAVLLSGSGKVFTAGIDLADMSEIVELITSSDDIARKAKVMKSFVSRYQQSFNEIEKCPKPVIAAIHNACIGAGVDMISACDIRYCTKDAWFQIKEVDIGLAADVGTLQRLPKIIGNDSLVRELAYTVRKMFADEASQIGLVSRVCTDKDAMMAVALDTAAQIASKSPVAVQGTKIHLNYSRDHTVQEGLDSMAQWNMAMLLSEDLMKAAMASMDKSGKPAQFSKL